MLRRQLRHYSLSDAPNSNQYRISVKRDPGVSTPATTTSTSTLSQSASHPGFVSTILHDSINVGDVIEVSHPYGDFFLSDAQTPVVLLSAGVGVTPVLSMLNTVTSSSASSSRKVMWVQGSRNNVEQAFAEHVRKAVEHSNGRVKAKFFHSQPGKEEKKGVDHDFEGYVDLEKVPREELCLEEKGTDYYVCGPPQVCPLFSSALCI